MVTSGVVPAGTVTPDHVIALGVIVIAPPVVALNGSIAASCGTTIGSNTTAGTTAGGEVVSLCDDTSPYNISSAPIGISVAFNAITKVSTNAINFFALVLHLNINFPPILYFHRHLIINNRKIKAVPCKERVRFM
jgi:hypothetical protein